jgi:ribose transport system substrate-binding protein
MNGSLRSLTILASSVVAILSADAAMADGAAGKRVAQFIGPQDKYLGSLSHSFAATATSLGMVVQTFSSPFDAALQAQQIDDAIGQKVDALVVMPISQKAIVPPLNRAKAAGIPVFLIVVPVEAPEAKDLWISYIGYDDTELGQIAGEMMGKELVGRGHPNGKIAILAGAMDEGKAPMREKAFRAAISKFPGMQVAVTEDTHWNPVAGEKAAGQIFARFAGQGGVDGVYGMNDSLANAAVQAAKTAGIKLGAGADAMVVIGGNCQGPGIAGMKRGDIEGTVSMYPNEEGKLAAETVRDYFNGAHPPRMVLLHSEAVTKDNLAADAAGCTY